MAAEKICVECGQLKLHKARGMCEACYQRWYREENPPETVASLRQDLDRIREKTVEEMVNFFSTILVYHGGSCDFDVEGRIEVKIGGRTYIKAM